MARVDDQGRAFAGSQAQLQLVVAKRTEELDAALLAALPTLAELDPVLDWVSPVGATGYREFQDRDFLDALGLGHLSDDLKAWWPRLGPVWDALAIVRSHEGEAVGALLVEAKSHVSEMGSAIGASPASAERIEGRLAQTRDWLGVSHDVSAAWSDAYYQTSNRYAHLFWMREVIGHPAWLANIYFLDDPHSPTGQAEWNKGLAEAEKALGLAGVEVPHSGRVFLPAAATDELLWNSP